MKSIMVKRTTAGLIGTGLAAVLLVSGCGKKESYVAPEPNPIVSTLPSRSSIENNFRENQRMFGYVVPKGDVWADIGEKLYSASSAGPLLKAYNEDKGTLTRVSKAIVTDPFVDRDGYYGRTELDWAHRQQDVRTVKYSILEVGDTLALPKVLNGPDGTEYRYCADVPDLENRINGIIDSLKRYAHEKHGYPVQVKFVTPEENVEGHSGRRFDGAITK